MVKLHAMKTNLLHGFSVKLQHKHLLIIELAIKIL